MKRYPYQKQNQASIKKIENGMVALTFKAISAIQPCTCLLIISYHHCSFGDFFNRPFIISGWKDPMSPFKVFYEIERVQHTSPLIWIPTSYFSQSFLTIYITEFKFRIHVLLFDELPQHFFSLLFILKHRNYKEMGGNLEELNIMLLICIIFQNI